MYFHIYKTTPLFSGRYDCWFPWETQRNLSNHRLVLSCCHRKHKRTRCQMNSWINRAALHLPALFCLHNAAFLHKRPVPRLNPPHMPPGWQPSSARRAARPVTPQSSGSGAASWRQTFIHLPLKPAGVFISRWFQVGVAAGAFVCLSVWTETRNCYLVVAPFL